MDRHRHPLTRVGASAWWRRSPRIILYALPLAFLAVFFVYPLLSILDLGLRPDGRLDLGVIVEVLADPDLREVAWFTLWQAALSTALTVVVALPGAYVLARFRFPGRRLVRALVVVPFVLPTVVVASAFLALLGPGGPLPSGVDLRHTLWAILIAHVFFNYAVVVRTVGGLWAHLDPAIEDAARTLGASRWRVLLTVTLPLLRPAIAAASAIVFLFTLTSFGIVLILGGPTYATLEVEIYRQTALFLNLPVAAALAVLQLAAVGALLMVNARLSERRTTELELRPVDEASRAPRTRGEWSLVGGNLALMALLLGTPLAVLVERSLSTPTGYGFGFYRALSESRRGSTLFVAPTEAVANSLAFATVATLIALLVGGLAAAALASGRGRATRSFDALLMLPLGTSAVTIGFGFLVALDTPPLDLRASPILVPIAHALVAIPFVIRTMTPVLRAISTRLREAAAVLGASPARAWREVDLPIVARTALVAAGFAFAVSLGEFGATVFIARADYPTVPIAIFRFLGQPGAVNFGQAMALSVILMGLTAAAVLVIERVRVGELGEF